MHNPCSDAGKANIRGIPIPGVVKNHWLSGFAYCGIGILYYHSPMSITIDRAGRIVVPKAFRERFGLHPGTELEIEAVADGLRLRARDSAPAFIEKEGVLVHHAAGPAMEIDVAAFINREREGRATSITPQS
jgi:AbrB family looped-hinge helix DNA binding protein